MDALGDRSRSTPRAGSGREGDQEPQDARQAKEPTTDGADRPSHGAPAVLVCGAGQLARPAPPLAATRGRFFDPACRWGVKLTAACHRSSIACLRCLGQARPRHGRWQTQARSGRHQTAPSPRRSSSAPTMEPSSPLPRVQVALGSQPAGDANPAQAVPSVPVPSSCCLLSPGPVSTPRTHPTAPFGWRGRAACGAPVRPAAHQFPASCLSLREAASASPEPRRGLPSALSGLSRQACGLL